MSQTRYSAKLESSTSSGDKNIPILVALGGQWRTFCKVFQFPLVSELFRQSATIRHSRLTELSQFGNLLLNRQTKLCCREYEFRSKDRANLSVGLFVSTKPRL